MIDFIFWIGGIVITTAFGAVGWIISMIFSKIDSHGVKHNDLETRFDAHRLYAAENYATKVEVQTGFDRVLQKLEKIDDKLDRKADKIHP